MPNLKPMQVTETEIGFELKMFKNRVNLDLAAYKKITIDQIVSVQISDASGFVNTRINSGRKPKYGLEALLNLYLFKQKISHGSLLANTAYNKTKVLSI